MKTERNNATKKRSDASQACAGPYSAAIAGNRLASLRSDPGHH